MGDIFKNLGSYGLEPWMVFVIVIVLGLGLLFHKTFSAWLTRMLSKKKKKYSWDDYYKHSVFNNLDVEASSINKVFETDGEIDENKSYIFNEFVKIKLMETKKTLEEILSVDIKNISELDLKHKMDSTFIQCNVNVNEQFKLKMIDKGLPIEDINSIMETFIKVRKDINNQYLEQIEDLFGNPLIEDNKIRVLILLSTVNFEIKNIIKHSVKTFDSLNGRFKKLNLKK